MFVVVVSATLANPVNVSTTMLRLVVGVAVTIVIVQIVVVATVSVVVSRVVGVS